MEGVLAVRNKEASTVEVWLEPWGDMRQLGSDATLLIHFSGPDGGRMEVEFKSGRIVVWGWAGSVMDFQTARNEP